VVSKASARRIASSADAGPAVELFGRRLFGGHPARAAALAPETEWREAQVADDFAGMGCSGHPSVSFNGRQWNRVRRENQLRSERSRAGFR
jgi:hypothetical protein